MNDELAGLTKAAEELADEAGMANARLASIKEIIDTIENRCMTADTVTNTRHEMTDKELQHIYRLAGGIIHK